LATAANPEASEIRRRGRQRLIGAVTLVALLVVFVPMLLDSEPRPVREAPNLAIPPKDKVTPLPAPQPATPVADKPQAAAPATAEAKPADAAPATVATASTSAPAAPAMPAPAPATTPVADAKLAGFAVQVGAFRDEAKLKQAREKLAAAGVVHYTERLETKAGPLTRLRAGPFPTREAAETALVSIKRGALDGKVVTLP
jgi:DedD protein